MSRRIVEIVTAFVVGVLAAVPATALAGGTTADAPGSTAIEDAVGPSGGQHDQDCLAEMAASEEMQAMMGDEALAEIYQWMAGGGAGMGSMGSSAPMGSMGSTAGAGPMGPMGGMGFGH